MDLNLIMKPDNVVMDYLNAFSQFNPYVVQIKNMPIIIRKDIGELKNKVVILSGGGSGHEPAHAGFVGKGMLSAAVAGDVFTSPPPNTILEGIFQIGKDNKCGVLLIIKNYTGDRINFNIAAERARKFGIFIEIIIVDDDTAFEAVNKACGRRGLAGTILIHKIAGAMADKCIKLDKIKEFLNKILEPGVIGTIGMSFNGNIVKKSEKIYEIGLGIHGEAGVKKIPFQNADMTMKEMVKHLVTSGLGHVKLSNGDRIALLVNNLGSCTQLELFVFMNAMKTYLEKEYYVTVSRGFCGNYVTSLNMYGISVTILKIISDSIIEYLDYPVNAPSWNNLVYKCTNESDLQYHKEAYLDIKKGIETESYSKDEIISEINFHMLEKAVIAVCDALINNESYLNDLDKEIGDADCGTTFKRGALALKTFFNDWSNQNSIKYMPIFLSNLSFIIENSMGGSSGGLLSLFFEHLSRKHKENPTLSWCDIFLESAHMISEVGGAVEGDRTMLDVIFPVFKIWKNNEKEELKIIIGQLVDVAEKSSQLTKEMKPKAGRASYVKESIMFGKYPDPGAEAITIILKAIKGIY